jgi:uncharacterized C2H2 Zn-finger protein
MCDNCFTTEIKSFEDRQVWTSFDLELTRKLGQGKVKHIKFIQDRQRDKDDGEDIYQCLTCGEKWKLRNLYDYADNKSDRYFLKLSTVERITTRLTERQKLVLGLLIVPLLILVNVIYWLWTH